MGTVGQIEIISKYQINNAKGFDDRIPKDGGYTKIIGSMPQGVGELEEAPLPDDTFADFCMIFPIQVVSNEKGQFC